MTEYNKMSKYRKIVVFEQLYVATQLYIMTIIEDKSAKQKLWLRAIGLIETWDMISKNVK